MSSIINYHHSEHHSNHHHSSSQQQQQQESPQHKPCPFQQPKRSLFFSFLLSIIMLLCSLNRSVVRGFRSSSSSLLFSKRLFQSSLILQSKTKTMTLLSSTSSNEQTTAPIEPHPLFEQTASQFRVLGVTDELINGLCEKEITTPTPVQKEVIPRILNRENIVMAAATGSGKTLAYVLPAMQQLQIEEQFGYERLPQRPRCLILVPTRELASQVLETIKDLSHHYKVSSCAIMGGERYSPQTKSLDRLVDIVVASPGRLLQHKERRNVFFSQVNHIIIDEVDTMLTQGFGSDIRAILRGVMIRKNEFRPDTQLVMATATLTKAVRSLLSDVEGKKFDIEFSDPTSKTPKKIQPRATIEMKIIEVDGVHRSLPHVQHLFEDTKGMDKVIILKSLLERNQNRMKRILVFCNTIQSCRAVEYAINDIPGFQAVNYHGDMPSKEREEHLQKFRDGEVRILVGTDIAARGLDIPEIDHVIIFDFPMNPIDYIHRAGRCGRAGRKGTVTSIVTRRDTVLANAIKSAIEKGLPIDSLTAAKKDYRPEGKLSHVVNNEAREGARGGGGKGKRILRKKRAPDGMKVKKAIDRVTPIIIKSRRIAFKRKQEDIVKQNPKYLRNALAKGRRGRVLKPNPKLLQPSFKRKKLALAAGAGGASGESTASRGRGGPARGRRGAAERTISSSSSSKKPFRGGRPRK